MEGNIGKGASSADKGKDAEVYVNPRELLHQGNPDRFVATLSAAFISAAAAETTPEVHEDDQPTQR